MTRKNSYFLESCIKDLLIAALIQIIIYVLTYVVNIGQLINNNYTHTGGAISLLVFIVLEILCVIKSASFMNILLRTRYCKNVYNLSPKSKIPDNILIRMVSFIVFMSLFTPYEYPGAGLLLFFKILFLTLAISSVSSPPSKIEIYTEEYTHYLYANNPTNIRNIILEIVSVYTLCNKKFRKTYCIKDCDVASNSLDIIYTSIYKQLLSDKYYTNNSLNECGEILCQFLQDVLDRQLKHSYISPMDYNIRKNNLITLHNYNAAI